MNQDQCLKLIELYKNHESMWNPKHKYYFNRNKREDAWKEISYELNVPISAVKRKMRALLGSYRSEKSKEKKSRVNVSGTEETLYESRWFAYQHLDFLRSRAPSNTTLNIAFTTEGEEAADNSLSDVDTALPCNSSQNTQLKNVPSFKAQDDPFAPPLSKYRRKGRKVEQEDEPQSMMSTALKVLQTSVNSLSDPHYTYALHLANEMRKYDPRTLASVKRAFANIIYDADMTMAYGHQQPQTTDPAPFSPSISDQSTPVSGRTSPEDMKPTFTDEPLLV